MNNHIINPAIPYVGPIPGGLQVNKLVRIQGTVPLIGDRFNINFQTKSSSKPKSDTILHISVRMKQGYIARNSFLNGYWGEEQSSGGLPITQGGHFEFIILCEKYEFKIAVNGRHFCEFPHRFPKEEVSYLLIDGDVTISAIIWEENVPTAPPSDRKTSPVTYGPPPTGPHGFGAPPPPGIHPNIAPNSPLPPIIPPFPQNPTFPPQPPTYPSHPQSPIYPPQPLSYPPQPTYPTQPHNANNRPAYPVQPGVMYPGSVPPPPPGYQQPYSNPYSGNAFFPTKKMKKSKLKKAMKYGLPIAGAGLGAYVLSKGLSRSSSSSSSSSSSD